MNRKFTLEVNETLAFELESHAGGGYSWAIASNDETITEVHLKSHDPNRDIALSLIGKSFPVVVEIKALAKGKSVILLEEKRAWEKDAKPLNTCKINITIK